MTTDEFAFYDAPYVLGALSPTDRREFEDHLTVCAACAGAVAQLAGLPGLMSRVSIDQLTAAAEPSPRRCSRHWPGPYDANAGHVACSSGQRAPRQHA